ncbi:MAG: DUF4863 family protein [Rhodospirillales bacterium]|jgi:hypothetical protein|nr:DUF4863 domain-containing protein [Rhodospirillaceae bacterium]MDP6426429.1 DUF4863 family protein [Rhodospirillales bacterium]MDP6643683.1 DUF4863 family protein [Rhodospirillales bacterium]MDP6840350.1 DUF4863 family protein [Rhodospirillales bacterium]
MSKEQFQSVVAEVTGAIKGRALDADLHAFLEETFPPDGEAIGAIRAACDAAIEEGWMCDQEYGGIKFGRVIKDLDGFSVDVVQIDNLAGPHHRHPKGEIDLVMPIDGDAKFDGNGKGWVVYGADTAHNPTVTGGAALVLYLLPDGEIEFTRS